MKRLFIFVFVLILTSCISRKNIDEVLKKDYAFRTIPQNDTVESVFNQKKYKEILILLHNRFTEREIINHLNISKNQYDLMINYLFGNGLIKKKEGGQFIPACMIIDENCKNELKKIAKPIGKIVSDIIIDRLPIIKDTYNTHYESKKMKEQTSFDESSFLVLSNVLLNKWQLKNIEEKFIKSPPPKRGGKNFYAAILVVDSNYELPIFLNRAYVMGNKIVYIYSKNLFEKEDFIINKARIHYEEWLFEKLASIITKDLIENLNKQKPLLVKYYLDSICKDEVSFREWLMWVYQFIVVEATKELVSMGIINTNEPTVYLVQDYVNSRLKN
ncbi:MAG: hypothetical protein N2249_00045 [Melioribacter sp.]|nr:hypothetical protein [Melioribacter sp.]